MTTKCNGVCPLASRMRARALWSGDTSSMLSIDGRWRAWTTLSKSAIASEAVAADTVAGDPRPATPLPCSTGRWATPSTGCGVAPIWSACTSAVPGGWPDAPVRLSNCLSNSYAPGLRTEVLSWPPCKADASKGLEACEDRPSTRLHCPPCHCLWPKALMRHRSESSRISVMPQCGTQYPPVWCLTRCCSGHSASATKSCVDPWPTTSIEPPSAADSAASAAVRWRCTAFARCILLPCCMRPYVSG
mmetsp:Transcript_68697/g.221934  ORF Transcript_68697/g.221934 Transcript_68697/m.221934 type:complete len:246 (-) Transcript_68697:296-1033(-)